MQVSIFILIPALGFCSYLFLLFLLAKGRRDKLLKIYIMHIIFLAVWAAGAIAQRIGLQPSVLFWQRFYCYALISATFTLCHFLLVLTGTSLNKFKVLLIYIPIPFLYFLNFKGELVKNSFIDNNHQLVYKLGFAAIIFGIIASAFLIICIVIITHRLAEGKLLWKNISMVYMGTVLVTIASLLNLVPSIGKYPIDFTASTINAFLVMYGVYRYKFLSITLKVKSGISYAFLATITATTVSIVINLFIINNHVFERNLIIFITTFIFLMPPFQKRYSYFIERLALGRLSTLKENFSKYINEISVVLDRTILSEKMGNLICKGFMIERAAIFLLDANEEYSVHYSMNMPSGLPLSLNTRIFYSALQQLERPETKDEFLCRFTDTEDLMTLSMQNYFNSLAIELISPIKRDDKLFGFIFISDRSSVISFSQDDIKMISDIIQASLSAFDNSYMYEMMKIKAVRDDLTNLFNERYVLNYIENMINSHSNDYLSIVLIDIDHFKVMNDMFGVEYGDRFLKLMANELRKEFPGSFITARFYKDLFVVVMPEMDTLNCRVYVEKFNKAFSKLEGNSEFTLSAGIATYPADNEHLSGLMQNAAKALEIAKSMGRDRIFTYSTLNRKSKLIGKIQQRSKGLTMQAIFSLVETINQRDSYTKSHSENVANYAVLLAEYIGLPVIEVENVRIAGLLHDIGKIGIREEILNKPLSFTEDEFAIMKTHVARGVNILKNFSALGDVIPAIAAHHEKVDGTGYPYGLSGDDISLNAKILAIADTFDAMTSSRPYREAIPPEIAIEEIKRCAGTQLDRNLAYSFYEMFQSNKALEQQFDEAAITNEL